MDARTVTTTYSYDALNRVYLKSYAGTPAAPNVTYCYDGQIAGSQDGVCVAPSSAIPNSRGRLTQMRSSASNTTHGSYDGLGRVTQSSQFTGTTTYPFSYAYNAAGLLTSLVYPSGRTVTTGYDLAGRPNTLGLGTTATQYVSAVAYMAHGAINQLTFGTGGVKQTTTYDPQRLQPTNISGVSSSSTLLTLDYGWCPTAGCTQNNGNLASQKISVGALVLTQTYTYDKLNRLASVIETPNQPGWNQTYTYDAYGNRAVSGSWIPNGVQTPQALNDYLDNTGASPAPNTNRWKAWTSNFTNGNVYDVAGNLQKVTNGLTCSPAPCPQYAYDAENRMVSATSLQSTPDTTYVYDGDGRRVQKAQSTATTTYVYDATGNLAAEYGTPTDHGTKFLLTDHLGSTRVLVASDGTSPKRYDYLPFGEEIQAGTDGRGPEYSAGVYPSPAGPQSLEFTGKERDAETGLDSFGARYMNSAQGRFTATDPTFLNIRKVISPQRWNLYSYGTNNPLKYVDPDGQEAIAILYPDYAVGLPHGHTANLGHAGVVIVDKDGSTHYFEYGRYEPAGAGGDVAQGVVRNAGANGTPTPSLQRDASGNITPGSLKQLLSTLSEAAGKNGPVDAVVLPTADIEDMVMLAYLKERQRQNNDPNRQHYKIAGGHNCGTLICETLDAAGHQAPWNRSLRAPADIFYQIAGYAEGQQYWFTPAKKKEKEVVSSKICFNGDNGRQVCQ